MLSMDRVVGGGGGGDRGLAHGGLLSMDRGVEGGGDRISSMDMGVEVGGVGIGSLGSGFRRAWASRVVDTGYLQWARALKVVEKGDRGLLGGGVFKGHAR